MTRVIIVIVNWNGFQDTLECLKSLQRMSQKNIEICILVIDNKSHDESVNKLKKIFPGVTIICNKNNIGFAGANNQGLRYCLDHQYDYVWLLNNDTIVSQDSLEWLIHSSQKIEGIIGSKIYFYPGREFHNTKYKESERGKVIWYAGGIIDWENMYAFHRGVDEFDNTQYDVGQDTDFVTGCSMLIPKKIIETVGFLDEKYFMYFEDVDYCLRVKRKKYRVYYEPRSVIWHINAGSSGNPGSDLHQYYQTRNRLFIGMRYASFRTRLALIREAILALIRDANSIRKRAIMDSFLLRGGRRI